jgi:hypothetical protein
LPLFLTIAFIFYFVLIFAFAPVNATPSVDDESPAWSLKRTASPMAGDAIRKSQRGDPR